MYKLLAILLVVALVLSSTTNSFAQDPTAEATPTPPVVTEAVGALHQLYLPLVNSTHDAGVEPAQPEEPQTHPDVGQEHENGWFEVTSATDQLVVHYRNETNDDDPAESDVTAATVERMAQAEALSALVGVELSYVRDTADKSLVLKLPTALPLEEVRAMTEQIAQQPEVEFAHPDTRVQPTQLIPNDPRYPEQWHYVAPTANNFGINLPRAWNVTTGSANVVVAVLDTGILNHPDLTGRIVPGFDFVADIDTANDGNGRDNDPADPGDWVTLAYSQTHRLLCTRTTNSTWHGTHVAGTIGANSNNRVGVAGVNWQVSLLPVRVMGRCGGTNADIADGIRWAAGLAVAGVPTNANPARVINLSLGGLGTCDPVLQNAINVARNAGVSVVVSAGNNTRDAVNYQPANCANVITVAATSRAGHRATYSNFGATVEISAPGDSVLSTWNRGTTTPGVHDYAFYQGTSMAAPHVAGVIALMLTVTPALTPAQVLSILQATVTPFPASSNCTTNTCGSGIVNAASAVRIVPTMLPVGAPVTALARYPDGRQIDLWVTGNNGRVYTAGYNDANQQWGGWVPVGVGLPSNLPAGAPVAALARYPDGRQIDLWGTGSDGKVYSVGYNDANQRWGTWFLVGKGVPPSLPAGAPVTALARYPDGRQIDIWGTGSDGKVYTVGYNDANQQWGYWGPVGKGSPPSLPAGAPVTALARYPDGRQIDLWVTGKDGKVYSVGYNDASQQWGYWFPVGKGSPPSLPAGASVTALARYPDGRQIDLWVTGSDGKVYSVGYNDANQQWGYWGPVAGGVPNGLPAGKPVAALARYPDGKQLDLWVTGSNGIIYTAFFNDAGPTWYGWFHF